jgi:hypothetical protein
MDYGKIVSTGWSQAWKHKTLWIFGFLIAGGGGTNISNFSNKFDRFGLAESDLFRFREFIVDHMYLILLLAALALLAFIIWIVLRTISVGGLVEAARQMKHGEEYRFGKSFGVGVHYFWRLLGIGFLTFVVIFAFIVLIAIIAVVAFTIHVALGVLSLVVLLPLFLVGMFIAVITASLAERQIVIENRPVFDSIGDSFNLWKSHLGPSVVFTLIYIGIGIAVGLGTLVILLFTVIPFVAVGFVNWLVAILIGIPMVLLILLIVEGFSGSAMHLMTTEFYFQLVEADQPPMMATANAGGSYTPPPPPPPPPVV